MPILDEIKSLPHYLLLQLHHTIFYKFVKKKEMQKFLYTMYKLRIYQIFLCVYVCVNQIISKCGFTVKKHVLEVTPNCLRVLTVSKMQNSFCRMLNQSPLYNVTLRAPSPLPFPAPGTLLEEEFQKVVLR